MGIKADNLEVVVGMVSAMSQLPRDNGKVMVAGTGLSRMTAEELDALREVLNRAFTILEDRISAAAAYERPEPVSDDIKKPDIKPLSKAQEGGEVEEQILMVPGIAKHLSTAWSMGNIGASKRYAQCIDRITSNIQKVISAQLYANLNE